MARNAAAIYMWSDSGEVMRVDEWTARAALAEVEREGKREGAPLPSRKPRKMVRWSDLDRELARRALSDLAEEDSTR